MKWGYAVVAALAASITLFTLQNTTPVTIRFVVWRLESIPLASVVLSSLAGGILVAGVPAWIRLRTWRSRTRTLEPRVRDLEAAVQERDRQLLRIPPGSGAPS